MQSYIEWHVLVSSVMYKKTNHELAVNKTRNVGYDQETRDENSIVNTEKMRLIAMNRKR